ncbi:2-phosphosulfolactate phosphatase [Nocardioides nanhaiensis]|uniref:2-phosphosulfolactate phosphatase n=1 Tax=Nocardioides nanhaiensis TaxID=1476871 RepID=UPI0031EC2C80
MREVFGQSGFRVRLDWGPVGARATQGDVVVVVDVLSFTTSVTVAVGRGMDVYPFPWRDERAVDFARRHDATLAVGRLEARAPGVAVGAPSLSPAGLLTCAPVLRLVLPSPNGSTIAAAMQQGEPSGEVVAGCLRNAAAVGDHLVAALEQGLAVSVVAAGERWAEDDSLRVALEDHLGAGAVLARVVERGQGHRLSPEARAAADLFAATRPRLGEVLHACVGGRELAAKGFATDVDVAAELDVSTVVPVLRGGAFGSERG